MVALEMIMKSSIIKAAQSSGKLTMFLDSGIRTGSDIIKALALGAQAVLRKFHPFWIFSEIIYNILKKYKWAGHGCTVR